MSRALAALTQQGLITSRPGAGSFRAEFEVPRRLGDTTWQTAALELTPGVGHVSTPSRELDASALSATLATFGADIIDLNGGYLNAELQPLTALGAALSRAARRPQAWSRPDTAGLPDLRDWFATDVGAGLARQDILIVSGGQGALSMLLRTLAQPGDPVIVESPTYPGVLAAAHAAGLRTIPIMLDREGMRVEDLDQALKQTRAQLILTQPLFQNPSGASYSVDRQRQLLDLAVRYRAFIIEDDFARHMAHADADPLPPPMIENDPIGAVIHIRSLTKVTSPSLRVAAVCARGPVMARLRAAQIVDTLFVPTPLQQIGLEVVTAPGWPRSLRTLATALQNRRAVAVAAIRAVLGPEALPIVPHGGYHLWLRLADHHNPAGIVAAGLRAGVAATVGSNYYCSPPPAPHLRVSYVAVPAVADLQIGLTQLMSVIDH